MSSTSWQEVLADFEEMARLTVEEKIMVLSALDFLNKLVCLESGDGESDVVNGTCGLRDDDDGDDIEIAIDC